MSSGPRGFGASGLRGLGASGPRGLGRGFGASGPRDFGASGLQGLRASRPVGLISGHQRVNIPNLWFTNLVYPSGGWARSVWIVSDVVDRVSKVLSSYERKVAAV